MSICIEQLRYVVLGTRNLEATVDFACDELGLQSAWRNGGEAAFRSDARQYTLLYDQAEPRRQAIGLEVADGAALEATSAALAARGIALRADPALAARRNVRALACFRSVGGVEVELVVRPQDQGWRFFASRDAGIQGLAAVALRSTDAVADEAMWREVFGLQVADWIGDAAYLALADGQHHRLSLHPANSGGVLAVEYQVEAMDQLMQQSYRLATARQSPAHGPGRRPVSGQAFVTFDGPDGIYYSFVTEGEVRDQRVPRRPRQFASGAASHCSWGSECRIDELNGEAMPARALRGVSNA
ncbi:MAG: oxidoreductase [Shinella sp.]|jgi:2,3-dihydroxy-p-cumate/2,3-dihydroxybenzoate 3,4-dioxygenase|nr:MAG: oxidoreductase [Shinella sp.]